MPKTALKASIIFLLEKIKKVSSIFSIEKDKSFLRLGVFRPIIINAPRILITKIDRGIYVII